MATKPRPISLIPTLRESMAQSKRKKVAAAESDSDSSQERQRTDRSKKRKKDPKKKAAAKKKPRRCSGSDTVVEKVSLNNTDPRKLLYLINPDYKLVREWVQKQNSSGHSGMADADSDEDTLFDSRKDTMFMMLDNMINQREAEESANQLTVERRNITNYTFLRHVMTSKDTAPEDSDDVKLREEQRASIYFSERNWEEQYMRPPDKSKGEQACVRGSDCIGTKIENAGGGFVLVAYYFKHEVIAHKRQNKALPQNRLCIFCLRNETLMHFVSACADQRKFESGTVIQMHRNSVKEYHPDFMVMADHNMRQGLIDPIVIQTTSATHYRLVEENGQKRYKQLIPRPSVEEQLHFLM